MKKYVVIIEKTEDGYGAYVPDLPGVGISAETKHEAEQLIYEAINFHIEGLILEGFPVPEPRSEAESLMIAA
jgi:predicted RNase H-like HicB family nuclease